MLLGRSLELEYLEQYYAKSGNQLLVVYGQKHVGKTALIHEFCKKIPHHYYLARPCSERQQRYFWSRQLRNEDVRLEDFPEFIQILEAIGAKGTKKKVIIMDEFQSFIKVNETFLKDLLFFLRQRQTEREFLVILCSSHVGFVENNLLAKIGTAAYEIHGFLKVKELSFHMLMEAFPQFSTKEAIAVQAVLGGTPGLWNCLDDSICVKENICRAIKKQDAWLMNEAVRPIEEQLRETAVYYTILSAMAEGKNKLNELYRHTGFSRAKISVYLKNLMELETVEKVFSFDTEGREHTKKGVYRIKNNLTYFYFRFLYPHLSELYQMSAENYYENFIEEEFDNFVSELFPQVCREYLDIMNAKKNLPFVYTGIGEWVGKAGSIHIVAKDNEKHCLVGFCNWKKPCMSFADYEWMLFCMEQAKISADFIYLFSICGFDERISKEAEEKNNLILIDMY